MIKKEAESPEIIKRRWDFKKEQIEILSNNIQKLRYNVTLGLKDTDNEKVFLTALVVAIILETSERVGNEASASNDRVGITGLKKKQVSIEGNKVTLEYTGKSGVEHIKSFSDEKIAKALKLAIKHSKTDDVFCTSDGFKIKADRINRFLSDFSVRAKDLRGMNSNKLMTDRLKNEEVPDDEKKRKKFFMQSLRKVAIKIGHGSATLRKHYLIPELEINYIKNGNIIDIKERDSYEEGGEIKANDNVELSKTPAPKKDKIYGSKINKPESAESKDKASSITLSPNIIKSIVNITYKHNEEYPEKKINTSTAKAVVRRGMGAYSSTHRPTISEGKPNSRVAWGLARLNAFVYKIQNGKSKSGKYNQDDDLIDELGYKVKNYSKGGDVSNIEFKCDYEKYFEYVPLSEIEKYIEFDREVEHKISKKYLDELTEEIKVNGITYPITLEVYGNKGLIVEGNHRIAVAKRLGIKYIPVRVVERYRPFTGTIYEDKVKELPSRRNSDYAKVMYGVKALNYDNSASVHGFTKVEPKFENGGEIKNYDSFKNWFNGSKVVDEFGKPKTVYHGTNRKFNVFDSKEIGQGTGNLGHYGYGFYFSDDIREAKGYGDIILECYLSIKKPFTGTDEEFDLLKAEGFAGIDNKVPLSIDFNDLHEKMKLVDSNAYKFMSIAKENGIDNVWSIYLQSHPHPHNHKIDLNDLYDILGYTDLLSQNNAVPNYAIEDIKSYGIEPKLNYGYEHSQSLHWVTDLGDNSKRFTDFIKSLGYDGVIYGSEYVAFYPNQIKLSDGTNTDFDSENPDIRFKNGGSLQEYLKRNNLEDNSYTEEDMDSFTNELNDELKKIGYITRVSKSKTNFGKSNYIFATNDVGNLYTPNEIKIRVSDHSVTNIDRVFNEFHISFPLKDKENSIKGALNKVKYYFDRGKYFYSKPIKVEKKSYNVLAETPNETDIITKEWTTKKGKNMYEVTRTYLNEAIGYFSKDNDSLYDTVFTDKFKNGGELIDKKVTFDNFYKGTTADFKEIMKEGIPKRQPDFISDFGSKYWFTANSVIRQSDHWGILDTCTWTLDGNSGHKITQGICKINNFKK